MQKRIITVLVLLAGILVLVCTGSWAQEDPTQPILNESAMAEEVARVLLVFLVLSLVFEVALTPIFNWRIFMQRFDGKGLKVPITVILAFVVFWSYDLDIIRDLLVSLRYEADATVGGQVLTALLIAGGSDGIFRIFIKLGIRNPKARRQEIQGRIPHDQAVG